MRLRRFQVVETERAEAQWLLRRMNRECEALGTGFYRQGNGDWHLLRSRAA
jgi:hypothetical protein